MTATTLKLWVSTKPNTASPIHELAAEIVRAIRPVLRAELRAESDRQSFAAASGLFTIEEAGEYVRMSRADMSRRRHARKVAKTDAAKDVAFAPEYGTGRNIKFRRAELDAWLDRQRR